MSQPAALVPASTASVAIHTAALVHQFLSGRSPRTLAAYSQALEDFRRFAGTETTEQAGDLLITRGPGAANALALAYRTDLVGRDLSPATVNLRLAALRSLVKLARVIGAVSWSLEVQGMKGGTIRDTRGPGNGGVRQVIARLRERTDAKGRRDYALVRLLYDLALRRGELVSLRLEDLDLDAGTVAVLGKGRTGRELLTLPDPTREALAAWIETRGTEPGPLFRNFSRSGKGKGLTGAGIYHLLAELGRSVGIKLRPHGFRHAAITEALDRTGGNLRSAQRFSRHRDVRTLSIYDDNRQDLGGEVARLVAAGV